MGRGRLRGCAARLAAAQIERSLLAFAPLADGAAGSPQFREGSLASAETTYVVGWAVPKASTSQLAAQDELVATRAK